MANKFDATGMAVQIHQTMVGQGVNGPDMGLSAPVSLPQSHTLDQQPVVATNPILGR